MSFHPRHLDGLLGDDVPAPERGHWARLSRTSRRRRTGHLRFRRQVVRDVAYAGLPFRVRRELHAAAGARLERDLGADADDEAARALAVHFHHAGEHEKAWRYARRRGRPRAASARRSPTRPRSTGARSTSRRQLDASARGARRRVGVARRRATCARASSSASDHALTTARRLVAGDPVRTAHLLWLHARIAERAGHVPRAVRWARPRAARARRASTGEEAAARRSHVVATLAGSAPAAGPRGRGDPARARGDRGRRGGRRGARARARLPDPRLGARGVRPRGRGRATRRARSRSSAATAPPTASRRCSTTWAASPTAPGRWDEAVELYREGADAGSRAGDVDFGAFADCNVGELLSDQGRLEEAEPLLRRALQVWRGTADEHGVALRDRAARAAARARRARRRGASSCCEDALARFDALRAEVDAALVEGAARRGGAVRRPARGGARAGATVRASCPPTRCSSRSCTTSPASRWRSWATSPAPRPSSSAALEAARAARAAVRDRCSPSTRSRRSPARRSRPCPGAAGGARRPARDAWTSSGYRLQRSSRTL